MKFKDMKRLFVTTLTTAIICCSCMQTRTELYEKFNTAWDDNDTTGVESIISKWEKSYPGDPEIYSLRSNYYLMKAVRSNMTLTEEAPSDGREYYTMTDSLGRELYLSEEYYVDDAMIDSAIMTLVEGIANKPDRIDFRLGKVTIHMYVGAHSEAIETVKSMLERSLINNNIWSGEMGKDIESDGVSYICNCIQDYFSKMITAGDFISAEELIDCCLEYYPENPYFIWNKGAMKFNTGDFKEAVKLYLKARAAIPENMLLTINLAEAFERAGDLQESRKYYQIVYQSGDPQYADIASQALNN